MAIFAPAESLPSPATLATMYRSNPPQGYDLSGLEGAVKKRFDEWVAGREGRRKRGTDLEKELFIKFSNEVFGIKDPKYAIQSILT